MKTKDFDQKFDDGEDVLDMVDLTSAVRPNLTAKRVNVDFPTWMVESLDKQAQILGVTRQSLIKLWVADKLDHPRKPM